MSGHSKWNNIKRKKEKTDQQRAKIFTKIGRELAMVVKAGGANPEENSKLNEAYVTINGNKNAIEFNRLLYYLFYSRSLCFRLVQKYM